MNIFIIDIIFGKRQMVNKKARARAVVKIYKNKVKYEEVVFNLLKQKINGSGCDLDAGIQSGNLCKRKQGRQ